MEADLDWDATVESPYAVSYILDVELWSQAIILPGGVFAGETAGKSLVSEHN